MCKTPNTFKQAKDNFLELYNNVSARKKAVATAEAKLNEAKKLILEAYPDAEHDDTFTLECTGYTINIGKEKKSVSINNVHAVCDVLNNEEDGLGESLMKVSYSITDLRKNLSDRQIDKLTTASYGARAITVKVG